MPPAAIKDPTFGIACGKAGQVNEAMLARAKNIAAGPPTQGAIPVVRHHAMRGRIAPDQGQDCQIEKRPDDDAGLRQEIHPRGAKNRSSRAPGEEAGGKVGDGSQSSLSRAPRLLWRKRQKIHSQANSERECGQQNVLLREVHSRHSDLPPLADTISLPGLPET